MSDNRFYVNWTEIDDDCKYGIIIGHKIVIYQLNDTGNMSYIRTDYDWNGDVSNYIMKNVQHGINYKFAVAGINGAGPGKMSPWEIKSLGIISKNSFFRC